MVKKAIGNAKIPPKCLNLNLLNRTEILFFFLFYNPKTRSTRSSTSMVKQLETVVDTTQGEVSGTGPAPSDVKPTSVLLKRFGLNL